MKKAPTKLHGPWISAPDNWRAAGHRIFSRNHYNQQVFGGRVWRIRIDGGFSCPNRDGTLGTAGCAFCDPASLGPSLRVGIQPIALQVDQAVQGMGRWRGGKRFFAYFQPGTNTYAPVEQLRMSYEQAIAHPNVVGLIVGTRPDCVPDEVLDLLAELAERKWTLIEYGLQSIHVRSLKWIGRGHGYGAFLDAVARSRQRGLQVGAHVILGLPGETAAEMLATADELARLRIDAVKLHNLHAVRGTRLAELVAAGEVALPTFAEYVGYAVDVLQRLPARCVVDRLSGDAPRECLVGPDWCLHRATVRTAILAELERRDSWQGKHAAGLTPPP